MTEEEAVADFLETEDARRQRRPLIDWTTNRRKTMNDIQLLDREPETETPTRAIAPATPSDLLRIAVQQNADLDKLERLMALQERWEAAQARNALKASGRADAAALAAAERKVEELRQVCESAIATHVRECAAHDRPQEHRGRRR